MSDHFEGDDRRPGIKRKAAENLDLEESEPKKLKRDPGVGGDDYTMEEEKDPAALAKEIEDMQRELALLDAQLNAASSNDALGVSAGTGGYDSTSNGNGIYGNGGNNEFSEDMESDIQVDDDSRGTLSQSRSRRTPRPNRNLYEFETDPEEQVCLWQYPVPLMHM